MAQLWWKTITWGFIAWLVGWPVFPLRKFYAEKIFDLVSMNILMLSLNELPTLWTVGLEEV